MHAEEEDSPKQLPLEKEEEFRTILLNNAQDAIHALDENGIILYVNDAVVRDTGYSREELIGHSIGMLDLPEDASQVADRVQKVLETGSGRLQVIHVRKDGSRFPVEIFARRADLGGRRVVIAVDRDISERIHVEEQLRKSEEEFRSLFESSRDAIMLLDRTGFFDCNRATLELFGCSTKTQFVAKHPSEVSPLIQEDGRDSLSAARERIEAAYREGVQFFEWTHRRMDGTLFPAEVLLSRMDFHGRPVLQATVRNIEARMRAEKEVLEREAWWRSVVENSAASFARVGSDGKFLFVNRQFLEWRELPLDQVLGHGTEILRDRLSAEDFEKMVETVQETVARQKRTQCEITYLLPSGRLLTIEQVAYPWRDARGKPIGVEVIGFDVSRRKVAEEALRTSKEAYQALVENLNDVVYRVGATGVIQYVSPAITNLLGYSPSEVIGKQFLELIHPEDRITIQQAFRDVQEGRLHPTEYRLKNSKGEYRWVRTSSRPVYADVKPVGLQGVLTDITRERQTKEALEESEARYRSLMEATTDLVFVISRDDIIEFVNPAGARSLGRSPTDIMGRPRADFFSGAVGEHQRQSLRNVFETGVPKLIEASVEDKARYGWLETHLFPLTDQSGNTRAVLGYTRDITERKRAEKALQKSEEAYRNIVENINDALFVHDMKGQIEEINDRTCQMTEYSRKELIGNNMQMLVSHGREEAFNVHFDQVRNRGNLLFEGNIRTRSGQVIWVSVSSRILMRGGRQLIQSLVRDISEHRRMEETIRESEIRYRALVEEQSEMVCRWLPNSTLTFVNGAYCRLFGKTREELVGSRWFDLLPEAEREGILRFCTALVDNPKTMTYTHEVTVADGTTRWVEWVDCPVNEKNGKATEFQSVGRDVTQKKRLEQQLAQMAGFEREKIKRDLHDSICQQLSGMAMLAENLHRSLTDTSPADAELAAEIQKVSTETVHLAREIARSLVPRLGNQEEFRSFLDDLAARIRTVYRTRCRVSVSRVVRIDDPDTLAQLFLIAQEAAVNAARHAQAKNIAICLADSRRRPRLTIRDDGIGIRKKDRTKGLGFDIMRSRANLIGWTFHVQSDRKTGTVVQCVSKAGPRGRGSS